MVIIPLCFLQEASFVDVEVLQRLTLDTYLESGVDRVYAANAKSAFAALHLYLNCLSLRVHFFSTYIFSN